MHQSLNRKPRQHVWGHGEDLARWLAVGRSEEAAKDKHFFLDGDVAVSAYRRKRGARPISHHAEFTLD